MQKNNFQQKLKPFLLNAICIFIGFGLFTNTALAKIKYGMWEITVKVQMDGMPVDTPQEKIQKCITRKNLTPGDNNDKEGCDMDKVNRKGDTVSWTVNCARDKHTMKGTGVVVYSDNTMTGHAQFQAGGKGLATMKMKLQYKGKRLGKCK
ncbi:MAG: DUF3617 domain-containing protein [Gammaproteobacteria bacterium]|nr:DUF3617 domain-containing protein [Gammaproteobacteria bacterium]